MTETSKLIYEELPSPGEIDIDRALSENDIEVLRIAALSVSLYGEDRGEAEKLCVQLATHEHPFVRANAVLGFGHIARIHKKLPEAIVRPIIERALIDPEEFVSGQAECAKEDTEFFLKWKYKNKSWNK